ncbi:MAG: tetratricopeptide repeat protein [Pyrinomonadaceae bacterium]|nr:tetratricopeptide repeat protein [Pyrinomonadaceae bacterium]
MRKVIFTFILTASALSLTNCTGNSANNGNANTNATATPTVETNVNANVTAQETPLPTFTDAETALAEGIKLLDNNSTDKAIEALKQAIKLNPDLADAHFRLGIAYGLLEAEKNRNQEAEINPTPTPTPVKKGKTLEPAKTDSEKAFENAVKAYKKILAKDPKNDAAHYNIGRAYNKLNEDKEAEKSLRQAIKLKPEDTEYQTEFGAILIKLAQYDEAVKALKKALELDSSNFQAEALLEKAEAGKKRVDFGAKQKIPGQPQQPQPPTSRPSRQNGEPKPASNTAAIPPPPPPKAEPPKVDKKGNP